MNHLFMNINKISYHLLLNFTIKRLIEIVGICILIIVSGALC